jgi:hypothetical protein
MLPKAARGATSQNDVAQAHAGQVKLPSQGEANSTVCAGRRPRACAHDGPAIARLAVVGHPSAARAAGEERDDGGAEVVVEQRHGVTVGALQPAGENQVGVAVEHGHDLGELTDDAERHSFARLVAVEGRRPGP